MTYGIVRRCLFLDPWRVQPHERDHRDTHDDDHLLIPIECFHSMAGQSRSTNCSIEIPEVRATRPQGGGRAPSMATVRKGSLACLGLIIPSWLPICRSEPAMPAEMLSPPALPRNRGQWGHWYHGDLDFADFYCGQRRCTGGSPDYPGSATRRFSRAPGFGAPPENATRNRAESQRPAFRLRRARSLLEVP